MCFLKRPKVRLAEGESDREGEDVCVTPTEGVLSEEISL